MSYDEYLLLKVMLEDAEVERYYAHEEAGNIREQLQCLSQQVMPSICNSEVHGGSQINRFHDSST